MNLPNTVTLWEVIYTIPYHRSTFGNQIIPSNTTIDGSLDMDGIMKDLQDQDKFKLTDEQYYKFCEFCEEINEFIDGIYDKYGQLSGMNGSEDADMICKELKVDHNHPTIVYDKYGNSKLNLYLYSN